MDLMTWIPFVPTEKVQLEEMVAYMPACTLEPRIPLGIHPGRPWME